ncbi:bifunctional glutamate N-acetyltransferase/amino-acid acetyltransferase ArgJ [bacterium]|nr:bifunctional glutamate N-acetyltransferase/amino-acid acetyltransferase ArgJ [bacterium]
MISKKGMSCVPGFKFSGIALEGKKKSYGLIYSESEHTLGAAVYTRNDIQAAPIYVSKEMDAKTESKRAILVNSGNANAFTGEQGLLDAGKSIEQLGKQLKIKPEECYVASTGVIGQTLPLDRILKKMPELIGNLAAKHDQAFAQAILTTDTRLKQAALTFEISGQKINLAGCVKGAGMIQPNMATMLCFVVTDAQISHKLLDKALRMAVDESFNVITVDGDTSTNDSVFILANGYASNMLIEKENSDFSVFANRLKELLHYLAMEIIADAEGITKRIYIQVKKARDKEQAMKIAYAVANSPLVKTAFFGEQLNWGRIVMAVGKAMTGVEADKLDININEYEIVKRGEPQTKAEYYQQAEQSLKRKNIEVEIYLNLGNESKSVVTTDLSLEYIKINANYIS